MTLVVLLLVLAVLLGCRFSMWYAGGRSVLRRERSDESPVDRIRRVYYSYSLKG